MFVAIGGTWCRSREENRHPKPTQSGPRRAPVRCQFCPGFTFRRLVGFSSVRCGPAGAENVVRPPPTISASSASISASRSPPARRQQVLGDRRPLRPPASQPPDFGRRLRSSSPRLRRPHPERGGGADLASRPWRPGCRSRTLSHAASLYAAPCASLRSSGGCHAVLSDRPGARVDAACHRCNSRDLREVDRRCRGNLLLPAMTPLGRLIPPTDPHVVPHRPIDAAAAAGECTGARTAAPRLGAAPSQLAKATHKPPRQARLSSSVIGSKPYRRSIHGSITFPPH